MPAAKLQGLLAAAEPQHKLCIVAKRHTQKIFLRRIPKLKVPQVRTLRRQAENSRTEMATQATLLQETQEAFSELREQMAKYEQKYGLEEAVREMQVKFR